MGGSAPRRTVGEERGEPSAGCSPPTSPPVGPTKPCAAIICAAARPRGVISCIERVVGERPLAVVLDHTGTAALRRLAGRADVAAAGLPTQLLCGGHGLSAWVLPHNSLHSHGSGRTGGPAGGRAETACLPGGSRLLRRGRGPPPSALPGLA
eukprot:COSAG01_NODE_1344_length_10638_cov_4.525856_5_plen_152_part_00